MKMKSNYTTEDIRIEGFVFIEKTRVISNQTAEVIKD